MSNDNREKPSRSVLYYISFISQIGVSMMVPIFLCLFIGIKISKWLDKDYIVLCMVLLGIVVAFRNVYILTKGIYSKDLKKELEEQRYFDDMRKEREARRNSETK